MARRRAPPSWRRGSASCATATSASTASRSRRPSAWRPPRARTAPSSAATRAGSRTRSPAGTRTGTSPFSTKPGTPRTPPTRARVGGVLGVPGFVENGEVPVRVPAGDRVRDPARVAAELGAVRARGGRQAEGRLEREAVEALVAVAQLAEPRLQLGGARRRAITHVSEVRARGVDGRCAVPSRRGRRRRGRRGRRGPPRAREAHFRRLARDRRPRALAHSSRAGNGRCSRARGCP